MARRKDSGFALLLVFLMAAVVAIMLYAEIPRVAFQSQRQKEQLLMERGQQYSRAIQMFYVAAKRFPSTLEELDTFQNRHFLRHKYVDPMTGKAEWRLIHTNGQMLTDSVLTKSPGGGAAGKELSYIDSYVGASPDGTGSVRPADRRRASEGGGSEGQYIPGVSPMPMPGGSNTPDPNQPNAGQQNPAQQAGGAPGQGAPGNIAGSNVPGGTGTPDGGAQPNGQQQGAPPAPGQPGPNPIAGGVMSPGTPGAPGQDGQQPPPNAAASLIGRILTTPNPQGFRIAQQAAQAASSGNTVGGGIAGVASKAEMEGIMVYNERTAYNEWEFIFDQTKLRAPAQMTPQGTGQPGRSQQPQGSPQTAFGTGFGGGTGTGTGTGSTRGSGSTGSSAMGGMGAALPSTYRPGRP